MEYDMSNVAFATKIVGLVTVLSLFGLGVPYAHANVPVNVTYFFAPLTCFGEYGISYSSHVNCGSPLTGGSLLCNLDNGNPVDGSLSTVSGGSAEFFVGGFACTDAVMTGTYSGTTFTVTSATYSISACNGPSEIFQISVVGPIGSFDVPLPNCSVSTSFTQSITPPSGTMLSTGQTLQSSVDIGELAGSCSECATSFSGSVTISGYTSTPIPEFPLGMAALVALALPVMMMLKTRYSAELASH